MATVCACYESLSSVSTDIYAIAADLGNCSGLKKLPFYNLNTQKCLGVLDRIPEVRLDGLQQSDIALIKQCYVKVHCDQVEKREAVAGMSLPYPIIPVSLALSCC